MSTAATTKTTPAKPSKPFKGVQRPDEVRAKIWQKHDRMPLFVLLTKLNKVGPIKNSSAATETKRG